MQVAGSICSQCNNKISTILGALGCVRCDRGYHGTCITGTQCPHCRQTVFDAEDAQKRHSRRRSAQRNRAAQRQQLTNARTAVVERMLIFAIPLLTMGVLAWTVTVQPTAHSDGLDLREELPMMLLLALGLMWIVCSRLAPDFALYRMGNRWALALFGERVGNLWGYVFGWAIVGLIAFTWLT